MTSHVYLLETNDRRDRRHASTILREIKLYIVYYLWGDIEDEIEECYPDDDSPDPKDWCSSVTSRCYDDGSKSWGFEDCSEKELDLLIGKIIETMDNLVDTFDIAFNDYTRFTLIDMTITDDSVSGIEVNDDYLGVSHFYSH